MDSARRLLICGAFVLAATSVPAAAHPDSPHSAADGTFDATATEEQGPRVTPAPDECPPQREAAFAAALRMRIAFDLTSVERPASEVVPPEAELRRKALDEQVAASRSTAAACFRKRASSQFTAGPADVVETLMKTAGQVVVDRAAAKAWRLLGTALRDAAGCHRTPPTFRKTCQVLSDVRLPDLIASPRVLLDAALDDLLVRVAQQIAAVTGPCVRAGPTELCPAALLTGAIEAGRAGGARAAYQYLRAEVATLVVEASTTLDKACDDVLCLALRAVGDCLMAGAAKDQVLRCSLRWDLSPRSDLARRVRQLATVIDQAMRGDHRAAMIKLVASYLRGTVEAGSVVTCGDDDRATCIAFVDAVETLLLGIGEDDWSRVAAGAIAATRAGVALGKTDDPGRGKLFQLLAAVGQYAATYDDGTDGEAAAAARRQAIESLIDATTDRSARDGDWIVSVGGQLGVGYGRRWGFRDAAADVTALPTPVHLALGLGLDTHHGSRVGFHGLVNVVDLSQYVAFEDEALEVADPDAKAALAIGVTAGLRFADAQTPIFAGVNWTYAPFVNLDDAGMTGGAAPRTGSHQILGLVGIYIPLFDLN